jgi:hypothetical protein
MESIRLEYDATHDVHTILHEDCTVATSSDVVAWRARLVHLLRALEGRRVYLMIDVRGFSLHPSIAEEYGAVAKEVMQRYAAGLVRYGAFGTTAATIRVGAIKHRFPSNIFPNREEALRAIAEIRQLPAGPHP